MADYNQQLRVSADISKAEKDLGRVDKILKDLNALAAGMSLRNLNTEVATLSREMASFKASTDQAWRSALALATAQKAQVAEQRALNDLLREAKGLRPASVETRATNTYKTTQGAKEYRAEQQAKLNAELADYERLAAEVAAQTRLWADNLTRIERSSNAGGLGKTMLSSRLAEFKERKSTENSAQIARERSATILGKSYGLNQVPAGGELFPGGNTKTAQPGYRGAQNLAATFKEAAAAAQPLLQQAQQRTVLEGKSVQVLRTRVAAVKEEAAIDAKSIEILRQQNAQRIKAEQLEAKLLATARTKAQVEEARAKQKKKDDMQARIENTLVSGAFPLLFGAGPLATAGGFAGGALGSKNPMIGVFTSAIGQIIDQFAAAAMDMAKSLQDPITNFQKFADAGLLASKSQEFYIKRLIDAGRATEAAGLIQDQIAKKIGSSGLNDMQRLNDATVEMNKAWADLSLQMQAFIAGPLANLLKAIAGPVNTLNGTNQASALVGDLQKAGLGKEADRFRKLDRANAGLGPEAGTAARLKLVEDFRKLLPKAPVKLTDEGRLTEATAGLAKAERAENLRRQGIALARQGQDFALQTEETIFGLRRRAEDIARAGVDLRRSVEDEIFRKRQELARLETDNARKQAQLAIERLDLQLGANRVGGNTPGADIANGLVDAVREYVKVRSTAEADLRQTERNFQIEMVELSRNGEKFRFEVSRRVADLQRQAVDYTRDVEKAKLTAERTIYELQIAAADYRVAKAKEAITLERTLGGATQQTTALTGQVNGGSNLGSAAYPMTSGRGPRWGRNHDGVDYSTPIGTPISTTIGGSVTSSGYEKGYGSWVEVKLENGVKAFWAHLSDVVLKTGQKFNAGQIIAKTGNTGRSTGPHLHSGDKSISNAGDSYTRLGGKTLPGMAMPGTTAAPRAVDTSAAMAGLSSLKAPAAAGVGDLMGVSAALDGIISKARQFGLEFAAALSGQSTAQAAEQMKQKVAASVDQLNAPLDLLLKNQGDAAAYQREYAGLISEGVTPALAEQVAQIKEQVRLQLEQVDLSVASLESTKVKLDKDKKWTEELQNQLDILKAQRGIIDGKGTNAIAGAVKKESPGQRLKDAATAAQAELNNLTDPIYQLTTAAAGIGDAFASSFQGIANGSMTAKEALANLFSGIAASFLKMSTDMIAAAIKMMAFKIIANIFGGGLSGNFNVGGNGGISGIAGGNGSVGSLAGNFKFADGGFVTGPTKAVVGEGGANEYVIPENKMPAAMSRYSAGARGADVLNGASTAGVGSGGVAMAEAPSSINISGGVMQFNDTNYIRQDQIPSIISQASKQGEARTLRRMQMNPATRRKLGMA